MKKFILPLIVILLTFPVIISLLHPGFFPSDDGEWMVVRLSDFHRSVVSLQLPVRWAARLNYGYGYPVFNFLYPLSLYFGEFFHLMGFNFVSSIKLVFIFSFILSGLTMYIFASKYWDKWAGLLCAILYVYTPYRLLDVYVRGSIGEALSFVFPPLILWSIINLQKKFKAKVFIIGSMSFAFLIMSHNIIAFIFIPVILLFLIWGFIQREKDIQFFIRNLLFLGLGLGLTAFFWFPALYDQQFTIMSQTPISNFFDYFLSIKQLIIPTWGYGPSLPGGNGNVSYQLGLLPLIFLLISLLLIFILKINSNSKEIKQVFPFIIISLLSIFLMLPISSFFWQIIPITNLIQFPWRILAITTFSISIVAGFVVSLVGEKGKILVIVAILLMIGLSYSYARPILFVDRGEGFYTTNEATTTVKDEYMPIWVQEKPESHAKDKIQFVQGSGSINNIIFNSRKVSAEIQANTDSVVQVNSVYFPGWSAYLSTNKINIDYQNVYGLINLRVPRGNYQLIVEFKETPVRLLADLISVLSLLITFYILYLNQKTNENLSMIKSSLRRNNIEIK